MKKKITITTQTYFDDHFYYSGWVLLFIGLPIAVIKWYVGIIALVTGIIIVTTAYKLVIDPESKKVEDFLYFLGKKVNLIIKDYHHLDCIFIKKGKYTQLMQLRAASTVIEGTMYSAYLQADIENFYLGESKKKKRILKKASKLAESLNLNVNNPTD